MGKEDEIPVIFQEKDPAKTKCRKSLVVAIGISCFLAATLIAMAAVGSVYITALRDQLRNHLYEDEANYENSARMQWRQYQQEQTIIRVKTNHPEMTAEAEQVWLDTKDDLGLGHINGKPIAVYRKDLDENYIAYWELPVDNNQYIIISAGKRTGDRKRVAQGNLPSMTQIVDNKALEYGRKCFSYYMVAPSGEIMCDDSNGRIVATSLDEEILTDSKYPDPHEYIENHLSALEVTWIRHAYDVSTSGEWDDEDVSQRDSQDTGEDDKDYKEEEDDDEDGEEFSESAAVPGHPIIIAVGNVSQLKDINIRYQPSNANETKESIYETQFKLCQCAGVCDDEDIFAVKRSLLKVDNDTGLGYLRFEICKSARDLFIGDEISFTFEISGNDGTFLRKRFGLEYESSRKRRYTEYTPWSSWSYKSIPHENYFPDYNQFKVGSCSVGCAAVAWAQIFGYFDRRSHYVTSKYGSGSQPLYRTGSDGTTGSNSQIAPKYTSDSRIRGYTTKIAKTLGTWCMFGNGATIYKRMKRVSGFFKARQTSGSPALHDRSYWLSISGIYYSPISSWARGYLNKGWPVIAGTREGGVFKQHYAVVTKYRSRSRRYRKCIKIFRKKICRGWKSKSDIDMYTHQGWGGSGNRWRNMEMWYAVAATY